MRQFGLAIAGSVTAIGLVLAGIPFAVFTWHCLAVWPFEHGILDEQMFIGPAALTFDWRALRGPNIFWSSPWEEFFHTGLMLLAPGIVLLALVLLFTRRRQHCPNAASLARLLHMLEERSDELCTRVDALESRLLVRRNQRPTFEKRT